MPDNRTQAERTTALEVQVADLREEVKDLTSKIDDLLELKNKGMGAFWLVSVIMGAGFSVVVTFVSGWFK